MNNTELVKMLSFISGVYVGKFKYPSNDDIADANLEEAWMVFMSEYKYENIMIILKNYLPNHPDWPPTVCELVKEVQRVMKPKIENITAEEAWEIVIDKIRSDFSYYKIKELTESFSDKIKRTIRSMGGIQFIAESDKNDPFPRKNFIESYDNISMRIEKEGVKELPVSDQAKMLGDMFRDVE